METSDISWLAQQRFSCRPPDGDAFAVTVRLGAPETVDGAAHPSERCRVGLVPLADDRWVAGQNGFQALCLSLDYIRRVFKLFVAEGGRLYWDDSDEPVDLDSPWFAPTLSPRKIGLRLKAGATGGDAE